MKPISIVVLLTLFFSNFVFAKEQTYTCLDKDLNTYEVLIFDDTTANAIDRQVHALDHEQIGATVLPQAALISLITDSAANNFYILSDSEFNFSLDASLVNGKFKDLKNNLEMTCSENIDVSI